MKAGVFYGPKDVRVEEVPDPQIQNPHEAIVKVTYSCICGSDLWSYRGITQAEKGTRTGHEFIGIVEEVGQDVSKVRVGDLVIAPFAWADGTCPECKNGLSGVCRNGGIWGNQGYDGGQGEKVRVPMADTSLFVVPKNKTKEKLMPVFLALSDVMCTGFHAAVSAGVTKNSTVAVIGDGAVGLCAVLASKYLGAKQIILLSKYEPRIKVGKKFGATHIVSSRGEEAVAEVKTLTATVGVDCVLECVGSQQSWDTALEIARAGGKVGYVGVPNAVSNLNLTRMFRRNIGAFGGVAPAASLIPKLLPAILSEQLDPALIFDKIITLDKLNSGYQAMDNREAIKVLIRI